MSRSVLVVNCGSSSIKYQLIDAESGQASAAGLVERIGADDAVVRHTGPGGDTVRRARSPTTRQGCGR